jgi:hypothetical protein
VLSEAILSGLASDSNTLYLVPQEVLLQQVTQQGDNLHFVALAAAQAQSSKSTDTPDMVKSLLQDIEV